MFLSSFFLMGIKASNNAPNLSDITERPGQVIGQIVRNQDGTFTATTKAYGEKPVSTTASTKGKAALSSIQKAIKK